MYKIILMYLIENVKFNEKTNFNLCLVVHRQTLKKTAKTKFC